MVIPDTNLLDPTESISLRMARYFDVSPLLAHAAKSAELCNSTRVEWLVKVWEDGRFVKKSEQNWTQIFRNPFRVYSDDSAGTVTTKVKAAFTDHIVAIERALWDGKPVSRVGNCPQWLGGVRHYLGRDPLEGDTVQLLILKDVEMLRHREPNEVRLYSDNPYEQVEFISEISLLVKPALPIGVHPK